jgi:hypothetical protein
MDKAFALFEAACVALAPPHVAEADAPDSLARVRQVRKERGLYVVSNENSDATIFSTPQGNFAFRAWHDAAHDECGGEFDLAGEIRTWRKQRDQLRAWLTGTIDAANALDRLFPAWSLTRREREFFAFQERILHCEVLGQLAYFETWRRFPSDQRAFAERFLRGEGALSREF